MLTVSYITDDKGTFSEDKPRLSLNHLLLDGEVSVLVSTAHRKLIHKYEWL